MYLIPTDGAQKFQYLSRTQDAEDGRYYLVELENNRTVETQRINGSFKPIQTGGYLNSHISRVAEADLVP